MNPSDIQTFGQIASGSKRKSEDEDQHEERRVQRRIDHDTAFEITIAAPSTLKKMLHILRTIVSRCNFDIVSTPEFSGLVTKTMDSSQSAILDIRLAADIQFGSLSQNNFSIPLNQTHKLIEGFVDSSPLIISQKKLDSQLCIKSVGAGIQMYSRVVNLNTLEPEDTDEVDMDWLEFDYVIDLQNVPRFVSFIKDAKGLDAQDISLRLFELSNGSIAFHVLFKTNDADMEDCFISNTMTQSNGTQNCVISRGTEFSTMDNQLDNVVRNPEPIYEESFSLPFLHSFISNIKANTITMRLKSNRPMLLEHRLSEKSIIRFLLSPIVKD